MSCSSRPFICFFLLSLSMVRTTSGHSWHNVFTEYGGEPDSTLLVLDLDQRSVVARSAVISAEALQEMKTIYAQGGSNTPSSTATLQSLSTNPYSNHATFQAFQTFYGGAAGYADSWIQAAFDGTQIFEIGNGQSRQADFTRLDFEGRSNAVRWGTLVLNVWMAVVGSLEKALAGCSPNGNNNNAQQDWNDALALFTGSLVDSDLPIGGYMLFHFIQIQCTTFGTCGTDEEAPVNTEIIATFVLGKNNIQSGQCNLLSTNVERIKTLLKVPLIQATLRAMYSLDREDDKRSEIQGEAAAFAAAVAPVVSECSLGSAEAIYNDMIPGNSPDGSFEVVKGNVERHYTCMGVTCADIGGIVATSGEQPYLLRAEACGGVLPVSTSSSSGGGGQQGAPATTSEDNSGGRNRTGLAVGLSFLFLGLIIAGVIGWRVYKKKNVKEFDTASTPELKVEESAGTPADAVDEEQNPAEKTLPEIQ